MHWTSRAAAMAMILVAAPAAAEETRDARAFGLAAAMLTDLAFTTYDLAQMGRGKLLTMPVGMAQSVVGMPQYLATNVLIGLDASDPESGAPVIGDRDTQVYLLLPAAMMSTAMTVHGLVSVIAADEGTPADARSVVVASALLGSQLPLTSAALGSTIGWRPSRPGMAVLQILLGGAGTVASAVAYEQLPGDGVWAIPGGLALFNQVHGVVSVAILDGQNGDEVAQRSGPRVSLETGTGLGVKGVF